MFTQILLLVTGLVGWANAQERTDRLDSLGWSGSVALTTIVQSGDLTKSALAVFSDVTYTWRKVGLTSLGSLSYSNRGGGVAVEREYLESVGVRFFPHRRLYPAVLGTVEASRLRQIPFRWNAGVGVAYNLIQTQRSSLKLSLLLLHETTRYNPVSVEAEPFTSPQNNYISSFRVRGLNNVLGSKVRLNYTAFVQTAVQDLRDYRWSVYLNVDIPITRHFALRSVIQNTYERRVVPGTSQTNFLYTGGLSLHL